MEIKPEFKKYKEELIVSIRKIINHQEGKDFPNYDGFDMSGYGSSRYHNMEIISRFKDYMVKMDDRDPLHVFPIFWKGGGEIVKVGQGYGHDCSIVSVQDVSAWSTDKIILECILLQNPQILEHMEIQDKNIEEEIKSDLDQLIDIDSKYEKTEIIKKFKRDYFLVKEMKEKHKKCQLCGFTFKKKNGENYNETHHIIPLSKNGKDCKINTLVVCANCHRQLHYAKVDISQVLQNIILINGKSKNIITNDN